jgi:hypothetical protein
MSIDTFSKDFDARIAQTKIDSFVAVMQKNPQTTLKEVIEIGGKHNLLSKIKAGYLFGITSAPVKPIAAKRVEYVGFQVGQVWSDRNPARSHRRGTISSIDGDYAEMTWNTGAKTKVFLSRLPKKYRIV